MKCKQYIYLLTSGQLKEAPVSLRAEAAVHRMLCRYCRSFTRNDARLDGLLDDYREAIHRNGPETDEPGGS